MNHDMDIRKISGESTMYTVLTLRVDTDRCTEEVKEALASAGFTTGEYYFHMVMTPGAVYADYDEFRLAREKLPGNAKWVTQKLQRIREEMRNK
jgi:hypothetical protein